MMGAATRQVAPDKEQIRSFALSLGFDVVGFASARGDPADRAHLDAYLAQGRHGEMAWMASTADRRADPQALWPGAESAIVCAMNYGPAGDPLAVLAEPERAAISVYARGRDYHVVMKKRLKVLARWLVAASGAGVKVFVDTAPLMEKPLAARAGLGWIGKHTNLVSRRFGSWLFLGEVLTTLPLPADPPATDRCGSCDACRRACPTNALPEPYRIEPRRCLSYLTIESAVPIPDELVSGLGNRIYGCDDCLAACPWNKFASPSPHSEFRPLPALEQLGLKNVAQLDDLTFRQTFSGTAMKRSGVSRMTRNALAALTNSER